MIDFRGFFMALGYVFGSLFILSLIIGLIMIMIIAVKYWIEELRGVEHDE